MLLNNYIDVLDYYANKTPKNIFLILQKDTYSYKEFLDLVSLKASNYKKLGIKQEDLVAVNYNDDLEFLVSLFAIWRRSAVAIPLDANNTSERIEKIFSIVNPDHYLSFDPGNSGPITKIDSNKKSPVQPDIKNRSELAIIMFTSGTSGIPKAVPITHYMICSNAHETANILRLGQKDRLLINTPAYLTSSIVHILTLLSVGGSMVIDRQILIDQMILDKTRYYHCSGFGGVPVHFRRLSSALENTIDHEKQTLRFFMNSGEHLPAPVLKNLRHKLSGIDFYCAYGLTEVAGRLCILPPDLVDKKTGSVGYPLPGMSVTIQDKNGSKLPNNQCGEVFVNGDKLMRSYINNDIANQLSFTESGFATGDIGYKDDDDCLYLQGRNDDIIKVGGEKVSLNLVEEVVISADIFDDFTVSSINDVHIGQVPCIYYVKSACMDPDWRKKLNTLFKKHLPRTHIPNHFIEIENIPRTSSGKVIRSRLVNDC